MLTVREKWRLDRARYSRRAWVSQPALWAVATYRLGQYARDATFVGSGALRMTYKVLHLIMKISVNIEIPSTCDIGPGLMIYHQGSIVINGGVRIGARCKLRQGVTIGAALTGGGVPKIGDRVFLGSNAQILGEIHVGDDVTVAAGAVVTRDVEAGMLVGGVPAKVIGVTPAAIAAEM